MPGLPQPKPLATKNKVQPGPAGYDLRPEELCTFVERAVTEKGSVDALEREFNGIMGLAQRLRVDVARGLTSIQDVESRYHHYGSNGRQEVPVRGLCVSVCHVLQDSTILLLMAVAVGLFALGIATGDSDTTADGASTFASVVVLVVIAARNDRSRDRKFAQLSTALNEVLIGVRRNGQVVTCHMAEIVVGDVVEVAYGNVVPADGILIEGSDIKVNEAALTGNPLDVSKSDEFPFLLAGTKMVAGYGYMVVVAVGPHTFKGNIQKLIHAGDDEPTLLQHKLETVGHSMGRIGLFGMLLVLCALVAHFGIDWARSGFGIWHDRYTTRLLQNFVTCIVLLVVVLPESLPIAMNLALSFAVNKMMSDNCLVRHVDSCEKLGRTNSIVTNKTGTLTTNHMAVMRSWFGGKYFLQVPPVNELGTEMVRAATECIAVNSTATLELRRTEDHDIVSVLGDKTEGALLMLSRYMGVEYEQVRRRLGRLHFNTLTSERKRMSVLVNNINASGLKTLAKRLYVTGASEVVLRLCDFYLEQDGTTITRLTDDKRLELMKDVIGGFAKSGLRTLCLAYRIIEDAYGIDWDKPETVENQLVCIGIVGIEDPLRPELPDSISECLDAGITVRMVTGDNIDTATALAVKARIFNKAEGDLAMEGTEFRRRVTDSTGAIYKPEFDAIWPRLRVLARCSAQDRHTLVTGLQQIAGEVVVSTGNGTADAEALETADVGFAMGISGTDVAKDAADIIILDDSFHSIVKAVLWGRNVFDATCKYLQFQLIASKVVLVVTLVGSLALKQPPFTPVQMLWINFIADPFGSLVLATEPPPTNTAAGRQPYSAERPVISPVLQRTISGHIFYQMAILFLLLFHGTMLVDFGWLPEAVDVIDRLSMDYEELGMGPCTEAGLSWVQSVPGYCVDSGGALQSLEAEIADHASAPDAVRQQKCERTEHIWDGNVSSPTAGCSSGHVNMTTEVLCTRTGRSWVATLAAACSFDAVPKIPNRNAHLTLLFNCCTMMTLFNAINCRKVHGEANAFHAIHKHPVFVVALLLVIGLQVLVVEIGGEIVNGTDSGLPAGAWLLSFILGLSTLVWGLVLRLIPTPVFKWCCCTKLERQVGPNYDAEEALRLRKHHGRWFKCHKKGGGKRFKEAATKLHHFKSSKTERLRNLTLSVARERVANLA